MAKYELSIKASYLPGWGVFEGIREIVANARDAEVQQNAPMGIKYAKRVRNKKETGSIVIVNNGTTLPTEALLVGYTTKVGDSRLIGRFGEGIKGGILALLRCGVDIKIRNGSEVWIPSIEHSDKFNADVLVFNVTKEHKEENRVQFEIIGVDEADWKTISERLLFIGEYPEAIKVSGGNILTSPRYKGQIFVKGMFVAQTNSAFGYDFEDADIDRDRRMVNDLSEKTSNLLAGAVNDGHLVSMVFTMMQDGSEEVGYISSWRLNEKGRKAIAQEFQRNNPGVIPVERDDQVKELESYGKKARQVPWGMRNILETELGSAANVLVELRRSEKTLYSIGDLEQDERDNLRKVVSMTGRACQKLAENVVSLDDVMVVDFHTNDRLGTYDPNTGKVRLARKILKSKGQALYTFVHEVAHTHGGDGVRSHEEAIGNIMEKILDELM
jgi:hypothetical protein